MIPNLNLCHHTYFYPFWIKYSKMLAIITNLCEPEYLNMMEICGQLTGVAPISIYHRKCYIEEVKIYHGQVGL